MHNYFSKKNKSSNPGPPPGTPTENKKKKTLLLPNKQALMLSNFGYNLLSKS
jgi:hypothetical protein